MTIEREPQLLPSKKCTYYLVFQTKKSHGLFQYKNYAIKIVQEKNIFLILNEGKHYRYKSGKILF